MAHTVLYTAETLNRVLDIASNVAWRVSPEQRRIFCEQAQSFIVSKSVQAVRSECMTDTISGSRQTSTLPRFAGRVAQQDLRVRTASECRIDAAWWLHTR